MTAFGLSICFIVKARKGLKSLPTKLEESNETIFQMKDAMYFSFKELQLNMDYIFCIAIRSNITLHDPFFANNNMDNSTFILPQFCTLLMTAFGLSIYLIVRARKGLTSLPIMLEESNETIERRHI